MWHHLSFLLLTLALVGGCPELFKRFSSDHTMCKPPNQMCEIVRDEVSAQDRDLILKLHNEFRSKVATGKETNAGGLPPAANMLEMVWDDELAQVARKLAQTCKYGHDCNNCRKVQAFTVGQNMGGLPGMSSPLQRADWEAFIKLLYSEVPRFDKKYIKPFNPGSMTGSGVYAHFTQVVWATSWRIGCGWVVYKNGASYSGFTVCNYGPAGNMRTGELYKVGPPQSACPKNSVKSDYPGLCKVADPSSSPEGIGPHDDAKYFFYCDFSGQDDCLATVEGKKWTIERTRGGNFSSIVLHGGEKTKLTFNNKFSPTGPSCTKLSVRKGPNVAGEADAGKGVVTIDTGFYTVPYDLNFKGVPLSMRTMFMTHLYGLNAKGSKVTLSFEYSVPAGDPSQFVEIQEISAKDGRCQL